MSLSLCSHQAEFCCHAATQLHSIILRSIKRCGYPGRRDFCLSFHSQCFFFFSLLQSFSSHNTSSLWLLSLPFLLILTPFPSASFLPFTFSLSASCSPLLSPQEVPVVMMKVLNIRGNPCRVSVAFSHLSFCARALVLPSTAQWLTSDFRHYDISSVSLFNLICSLWASPITGFCLMY